MFEREEIQVDLYCNQPRNGRFAGHVWALKVGPNMEFESKFLYWGPKLRFLDRSSGGIAIAGKHFPITHHNSWVGNWCWEAVRMEGRYVLELLNWPRFRRWFDLEEAEVRLFNYWRAGGTWKDSDLRLLGKEFAR